MSDPQSPRPARLELLVRRQDDGGFEVRQITSTAGWVSMRPQRVPAEAWELAEVTSRVDREKSFILRNTRTDRYLILSEAERFLWDHMDGRASVQDLATAYVLKFGQFDFQLIPVLIRKLQRAELLIMAPASRLRRALARHRERRLLQAAERALTALERVNISSQRVHATFHAMYRWGGFLLFTRLAMGLWLLLGVAGLVAAVRLWREASEVAAGLGANPVLALLTVKGLFIVTLAAHQVVHGLALIHYGRRVREFGFTFIHGFVPSFYVDVTDIFMASRRARIITALSGTLVHLVLGALCFLIAARTSDGFVQAFAAASGLLQWQAFVVSLYPFCFIEMDGYHILVDWLGEPTLKHDALAWVRELAGGAWVGWSRETALWAAYVALSAVSLTAFVVFNVWIVVRAAA